MTYFASFADADLARELYGAIARRGVATFVGFGGVREYSGPEEGRAGDIDSGPVAFGVSVSASGFALAGARMFGDAAAFRALFRTAYLFGAPEDRGGARGYFAGAGLGDAILLGNGQALHEHGAKHREHRDGHPDAEAEDDDGGREERGCATEAAEREAEILPEFVHLALTDRGHILTINM